MRIVAHVKDRIELGKNGALCNQFGEVHRWPSGVRNDAAILIPDCRVCEASKSQKTRNDKGNFFENKGAR
jgi:hypothetical protein